VILCGSPGNRDGPVVAMQKRNDRVVPRVLDVRHVQRDSACVKERLQVSVPMVVGLAVLAGNRAAGAAGVVLAPPNADGLPWARCYDRTSPST